MQRFSYIIAVLMAVLFVSCEINNDYSVFGKTYVRTYDLNEGDSVFYHTEDIITFDYSDTTKGYVIAGGRSSYVHRNETVDSWFSCTCPSKYRQRGRKVVIYQGETLEGEECANTISNRIMMSYGDSLCLLPLHADGSVINGAGESMFYIRATN